MYMVDYMVHNLKSSHKKASPKAWTLARLLRSLKNLDLMDSLPGSWIFWVSWQDVAKICLHEMKAFFWISSQDEQDFAGPWPGECNL